MWGGQVGSLPRLPDLLHFFRRNAVTLEKAFQRFEPRQIIVIPAIQCLCEAMASERLGKRVGPIRPSEQLRFTQMNGHGEDVRVPRFGKNGIGQVFHSGIK